MYGVYSMEIFQNFCKDKNRVKQCKQKLWSMPEYLIFAGSQNNLQLALCGSNFPNLLECLIFSNQLLENFHVSSIQIGKDNKKIGNEIISLMFVFILFDKNLKISKLQNYHIGWSVMDNQF